MHLIQDLASDKILIQTETDPFEVSIFTISNVLSGLSGVSMIVDSQFTSVSSGSVWNSYVISAGTLENEATITNLSPSIATLSGDLVVRVADGVAAIKANVGPVIVLSYLDMTQKVGSVVDTFVSYLPGSMSDTISNNLIALLSSNASVNYYDVADNTTGTFQKSLTSWASDLDLTAISVATDTLGIYDKRSNATLVTPRHVVGAKHWNVYFPEYSPASGWIVGSKIKFCDRNDTVHVRSVSSVVYLEDIAVATLDSDLPDTVTPMKIMGEWFFRNRTPINSASDQYYASSLGFHMNSQFDCHFIVIGGFEYSTSQLGTTTINGSAFTYDRAIGCLPYQSVYNSNTPEFIIDYSDYYRTAYGGDSGNPAMVVLSGSPVMLWAWQYGTGGPSIANTGLLNAMIEEADAAAGISTGYTATVASNPI